MKRIVKFKDKKGNLAVVEVNLEQQEKGLVFSASGEYKGSMGQCLDSIEPKNEPQNALIDLWKKYHLNDMNAGCIHQDKWQDIRINPEELPNSHANRDEKGILASWVYPKDHEKGFLGKACPICGYKYGTSWLYRPLPDNIEEEINNICNAIENIENAEREINQDNDISWEDIEDEKIIALGKHLQISPYEAQEDIKESDYGDCLYEYAGQEYLVCTDDEADEKEDEQLESYIDECLEIPEHVEKYFDREAWKEDARINGRGNCLNRYDSSEDEEEVNGETYYIYRQN